MKLPAGHQAVMTYLMLEDTTAFIDFTKKVFGAQLSFMKQREDDPSKVMHAEITIGGITIMMADTTAQWGRQTANMFVYVPDADETYRWALDAGAQNVMEPADQSYGRSCGVTDPQGNTWWITSVK